MHNTLVIQVIILLITLALPIGSTLKTVLIILLLGYSYKSWLITRRLLDLGVTLLTDRAQDKYRDIANRIFRDNFRFRSNFSVLPSKPTILMTTYPTSLIEYLALALLPGSTCLLAAMSAKRWVSKVYKDKECCYIPTQKGGRYEVVKELVRERLKDMHVIMYVENKERRYGRSVGNLWKGAFWMANELGATITPLIIDKVDENWCAIPEQNFEMYVGPTMHVSDPLSMLIKVRTMMRKKKTLFSRNKFYAM